jgi:Na+/H+ antiporter NhaC
MDFINKNMYTILAIALVAFVVYAMYSKDFMSKFLGKNNEVKAEAEDEAEVKAEVKTEENYQGNNTCGGRGYVGRGINANKLVPGCYKEQ